MLVVCHIQVFHLTFLTEEKQKTLNQKSNFYGFMQLICGFHQKIKHSNLEFPTIESQGNQRQYLGGIA